MTPLIPCQGYNDSFVVVRWTSPPPPKGVSSELGCKIQSFGGGGLTGAI